MAFTLPRNAQLWLPGYLKTRFRDHSAGRPAAGQGRVWLSLGDHFEPLWNGADDKTALQRVTEWRRKWPEIAARSGDVLGHLPEYTFYYPQEEYRPWLLEPLAEMTRAGCADVEVHIHHDGEGKQNFLDRMSGFLETLERSHGLLRRENGRIAFGFIHGNWALDNGRPDGRWCGLNDEITLLRDLGCYADFTMPSGSSPTQSRTVNTIYWATDDPTRPRSYDHGEPLRPGVASSGDLLMVPGPLAIRWTERLVPRLETGEMACQDLCTPYRVRRWLDVAPALGDDIFVKLYTHGAQERNSKVLLGGGMEAMYRMAADECRLRGYQLFCLSTWKMFQAIRAVHQGHDPVTAVFGKASSA